MPISSGHLRALTKERLTAERPTIAPVIESSRVTVQRPPLLAAVINSAPTIAPVTHLPDAISLVPLDFGRAHIPDAVQLFGWEPGTHLNWSIEADHLLLVALAESKGAVDLQSRFLLPVTARRRLGITDSEQVFIITSCLPSPHLRIYPRTSLINALSFRNEK